MKDTFWTDELALEFAKEYRFSSSRISIEQFKSSKAPKKEWEVVAFTGEASGRIYRLRDDEKYGIDDYSTGFPIEELLNDHFTIHSVRRLSDGEVFSVGDRIKCDNAEPRTIESFEETGLNCWVYYNGGHVNLCYARKLPAPVLTTVDGKEIYKDQKYWVVESMEEGYIPEYYANENNKTLRWPAFSTREAAETYILNNLSLLSLNDVKEAAKNENWHTALIERLTALVKQKLNQ